MIDLQGDADPGDDPWVLVEDWLPADDDPDRPQAVLATVGTDGCPNARTVLVSAVDRSGFAVHTHRDSRKVAELAAVPRAAMVVTWPGFTRQLVVRGDVVADAADSAARVWSARSEHLRRLAWLNDDVLAGRDRAGRVAGWAADVPVQAGSAPAPSWTGFRVMPQELTFWAGGADTASRRLQYRRVGEGWTRRWLAG
ncbi:pyridoxamine 5'-phosphate oxidase family protein [Klenkia sp. PcliD-1-E]|uniref:pyridoxamine 5'-phosphate oxidase family protein n=1 Tax=Klenkia sp. PcliD-1-E TaxID=2954492 RepID=UPI0020980F5C|nr:pyridoxamine 5'-phosphate oxidase family protein [Klenkia sp. PcliD-1-E]MCO7220325.1 pyridoxamine 5'-phosphate oxidase family protein [Klenkia sp. PcliD-1-E]